MQCAVTSTTTGFVSLSLAGDINVFDLANRDAPVDVLVGHRSRVGSVSVGLNGWVSGGDDGAVIHWVDGRATQLASATNPRRLHNGKVTGVAVHGESVISVGFDDTIRFTVPGNAPAELPCNGQPIAMHASLTGLVAVATMNAVIQLFRDGALVFEHTLPEPASCVAVLGDDEIAVGLGNLVHVFAFTGDAFTQTTTLDSHRGKISSIAYSSDGEYMAVGDANREIKLWQRSDWSAKVSGKWVFHTTTISTVAFSPSNEFVASGSLDESIFVWSVASPMKKKQIKFAHKSGVASVGFLDETTLISSGNDGVIAIWDLTKE